MVTLMMGVMLGLLLAWHGECSPYPHGASVEWAKAWYIMSIKQRGLIALEDNVTGTPYAQSGSAVVGTYSYEIAEQKSIEATKLSRENGFPLQIALEKE